MKAKFSTKDRMGHLNPIELQNNQILIAHCYPLLVTIVILTSFAIPKLLYAADSCNALLTVGIYNVAQGSNSSEGESLAKSTFCSADYSLSSITSTQQASIKASFSFFSGGASGSVSDSQIIETQKNVCTSGFNSSAYRSEATSYAQTIYQGALDAWNQCNALAVKGLNFEIQADNTMQGLTVSISTASTGTKSKFMGLSQTGLGRSVCKTTTTKGQVVTLAEDTMFNLSSANKLTVICQRTMNNDGSGNLFADAQSLIFNTSTGVYQVPLSGIGSLSRVTTSQIIDEIKNSISNDAQILIAPVTAIVNSLGQRITNLETAVNNLVQRVTTNETSIGSLGSRITTLESAASTKPSLEVFYGSLPVGVRLPAKWDGNQEANIFSCPSGFHLEKMNYAATMYNCVKG